MSRFQYFIFLKMLKEHLKMVNVNYYKMARSGYIVILINLQKEPRTSFQAPTLSQKHVRSVSLTANQYLINFFIVLGFKRNKQKCNFHYVAMHMMTSQILKFVHFTKTQKSRYLKNKALFFLQIKQFINCASVATVWQKTVLQQR